MCTTCAWCPWRLIECTGSPENRVADGSKLPCDCWASYVGLLKKQQVMLTTEPSLQSIYLSDPCLLHPLFYLSVEVIFLSLRSGEVISTVLIFFLCSQVILTFTFALSLLVVHLLKIAIPL